MKLMGYESKVLMDEKSDGAEIGRGQAMKLLRRNHCLEKPR